MIRFAMTLLLWHLKLQALHNNLTQWPCPSGQLQNCVSGEGLLENAFTVVAHFPLP